MDAELKPCPFCGAQPSVKDWGPIVEIRCKPCGIYGPTGRTHNEAAEKWNRRAPEPPAAAGPSREEDGAALSLILRADQVAAFGRFVRQMKLKLAANADKTGWRKSDGCTMSFLWDKLNEERAELRDAVNGDADPQRVAYEAADVANIAMMIADHYRDDVARKAARTGGAR